MADYYAILKRAVEAMPTQTREQRQTIYDKARKALLSKLQNMDPPLPPADISKQRMALEEAVRAVERDLSSGGEPAASLEQKEMAQGASVTAEGARASAPALAGQERGEASDTKPVSATAGKDGHPPVQPPKEKSSQTVVPESSASDKVVRRAGQDVLKNAVRDANALGKAANKAVKHAQDAADAVGEERDSGEVARIEPTLGDAVISESKTYKRSSMEDAVADRPGYASEEETEESSKSRFGVVALVLVIVAVLAGSGYLLYANKDAFFSSDGASSQENAAGDTSRVVGKTQNGNRGSASTDMPAKSVRTITVTPPDSEVGAAAEEDTTAQNDANSADGVVVANGANNNTVSSGDATLPVAQRAILYEEPGGEGEPGSASAGEVVWSVEGQGDDAIVDIKASIADKDMTFDITIKKNLDAELPASHLIEIAATRGDDNPKRAIVKIPGLILKPTEQSRGEGLIGAAIRIADDLHWVALTSGEREERYNLELLHLRGWIDIPIQYQSGRRAILTLEKGEAGDQVISDAIKAWSGQ